MGSVFILSLTFVAFACIFHEAAAVCKNNKGPTFCTSHAGCRNTFACLTGKRGSRTYCRYCPCNETSQCRVDSNQDVYCSCGNSSLVGPSCNCEPPPPKPACPAACPTNFTMFNDMCKCFYVEKTSPVSWESAKTFCESKNSFLTKITTAEQNTFVKELAAHNTDDLASWIGGSDVSGTGNFVWDMDGSSVIYDNWGSVPVTGGSCIAMLSLSSDKEVGKWQTFPCTDSALFVCEYLP